MWLMLQTEIDKISALYERIPNSSFDGFKISSSAWPMEVKNGTAHIKIEGPTMAHRDAMLDFFGVEHTAYDEIVSQISDAESRGAKRGKLHINSPGGELPGMYNAMNAVRNSSIQWEAEAGDVMASAAYMIGSQAQRGIHAKSEMSLIGAVGVATSASTSTWRKDISNTDSPKKRPDASTEEGVSIIRSELDDIFNVLAERIAEGRGVTAEIVKKNYGEGAVLTARTAKEKGLIDSYEKNKPAAKQAAINGENKMDLRTLKAEHPEVYALAFAEGEAAERKRVASHCELAKMHNTASIAIEDIACGKEADILAYARHKDAAEKAKATEDRGNEAPPAVPSGNATAAVRPNADRTPEQVASELMAKHKGVKIEVRA